MRPKDEKLGRLLTFRSGGWVLLLAGLSMAFIVAQAFRAAAKVRGERIGDGVHVETYGFDLTTSLVPVEEIHAAGMHKDGVHALVEPELLSQREAATGRDERNRKLLVSGEQVVGVVIAGEPRAYPVRFLNWHEVVNDTLGGREILVVWHPLVGFAGVFDRRVGGRVLVLGVSGLVWNSCPLLYDRTGGEETESLWCALQARAVTGPAAAAGATLEPLPMTLATWAEWKERHPGTSVIAPLMAMKSHYGRKLYTVYRDLAELRFPVSPYPPPGDVDPWTTVVASGGKVVPEDRFAPAAPVPAVRAYWWAWYATHPGATLSE